MTATTRWSRRPSGPVWAGDGPAGPPRRCGSPRLEGPPGSARSAGVAVGGPWRDATGPAGDPVGRRGPVAEGWKAGVMPGPVPGHGGPVRRWPPCRGGFGSAREERPLGPPVRTAHRPPLTACSPGRPSPAACSAGCPSRPAARGPTAGDSRADRRGRRRHPRSMPDAVRWP